MDFTAETVTMIINAVFIAFLTMGFLYGIARGFKKSVVRFIFIVAIAGGMYVAAPIISNALLTVDLSGILGGVSIDVGGEPHTLTTLQALLTAFLNSSQAVQNFVEANPTFIQLVEQLPLMVSNLVIFFLGFWILKIITWPIFAIMVSGYNKKDELGLTPNKRSFAGGVVGIIQGAVIALVTFMPIAGISSMITVEGNGGGANLLADFLPASVIEFLPVYENSFAGILGGIGGMDEKVFDGLTTIRIVNEETGEVFVINPRQEIITGMEIWGDIDALITMFEGIENGTVTEIDWDLIEGVVDKIFDLNTIELLVEEYAPYLAEEATTNEDLGYDEMVETVPASNDVDAFVQSFVLNLDEATIENFKTDVLALVHVGKALDEHGVLDLVIEYIQGDILEEELIESSLEILATSEVAVNDVITAILESNSLKTLMPEAINVVLGVIEEVLNDSELTSETIAFTRLSVTDIDWEEEAETFTDIFHSLIVVVYELDVFNLGETETMEVITSVNFAKLGEIINAVRDSQLFGTSYTEIIEAVFSLDALQEFEQYLDFDALIDALDTTNWVDELSIINDAAEVYELIEDSETIEESDISELLESMDESVLIDIVMEGVLRALLTEGLGENVGQMVDGTFVYASEFEWVGSAEAEWLSANDGLMVELLNLAVWIADGNDMESITQTQLDDLNTEINTMAETTTELAALKAYVQAQING